MTDPLAWLDGDCWERNIRDMSLLGAWRLLRGLKRARDSWRRECLAWESQAAGLHEALATERGVSDRLRAEVAASESRAALLEKQMGDYTYAAQCANNLAADAEDRAAAAEGALGECRAVLAEVAYRWCPHSGLCCRCVDGRIFVTEETCECDELHRKVQRIAGIEPYEAAAREGRKG